MTEGAPEFPDFDYVSDIERMMAPPGQRPYEFTDLDFTPSDDRLATYAPEDESFTRETTLDVLRHLALAGVREAASIYADLENSRLYDLEETQDIDLLKARYEYQMRAAKFKDDGEQTAFYLARWSLAEVVDVVSKAEAFAIQHPKDSIRKINQIKHAENVLGESIIPIAAEQILQSRINAIRNVGQRD